MSLITRQGKGSKLTIQEMDGNLEFLNEQSQNGGALYKEIEIDITNTNHIRQNRFINSPVDVL